MSAAPEKSRTTSQRHKHRPTRDANISTGAVKRMVRRAGCTRVARGVIDLVRMIYKNVCQDIVRKASVCAEHARTRTLFPMHVRYVARLSTGRQLYDCDRPGVIVRKGKAVPEAKAPATTEAKSAVAVKTKPKVAAAPAAAVANDEAEAEAVPAMEEDESEKEASIAETERVDESEEDQPQEAAEEKPKRVAVAALSAPSVPSAPVQSAAAKPRILPPQDE